jgi:hypothetical protein
LAEFGGGRIVDNVIAWVTLGTGRMDMTFQKRPQNRNIFWIQEQLFATSKVEQQKDLLKLLILEQDGLAQDTDTLRLLEHLISECRVRLTSQRGSIANHEQSGRDATESKRLLSGMMAALALHIERHARISRRC